MWQVKHSCISSFIAHTLYILYNKIIVEFIHGKMMNEFGDEY